MKEYFKYLKEDLVIWVTTLILLVFSLVGATMFAPMMVKMPGGLFLKYSFGHLFIAVLTFAVLFWIQKHNSGYYTRQTKIIFSIVCGLLTLLFVFSEKINGSEEITIPATGLVFLAMAIVPALCMVFFLMKENLKKMPLITGGAALFFFLVVTAQKIIPELNMFPHETKAILNDQVHSEAYEKFILNGAGTSGDKEMKQYIPQVYADYTYASTMEVYGYGGGMLIMTGSTLILFVVFSGILGIKRNFRKPGRTNTRNLVVL